MRRRRRRVDRDNMHITNRVLFLRSLPLEIDVFSVEIDVHNKNQGGLERTHMELHEATWVLFGVCTMYYL